MSNSLAKKFDKIVSKLGSKHKETKSNSNDINDNQSNLDDTTTDGNEPQHESILQRVKGHLGHSHGSSKNDSHHNSTEGAPPAYIITEELKDSPFKGKIFSKYFLFFSTICNSMHIYINFYMKYFSLHSFSFYMYILSRTSH